MSIRSQTSPIASDARTVRPVSARRLHRRRTRFQPATAAKDTIGIPAKLPRVKRTLENDPILAQGRRRLGRTRLIDRGVGLGHIRLSPPVAQSDCPEDTASLLILVGPEPRRMSRTTERLRNLHGAGDRTIPTIRASERIPGRADGASKTSKRGVLEVLEALAFGKSSRILESPPRGIDPLTGAKLPILQ
jgi:hypothetical protein